MYDILLYVAYALVAVAILAAVLMPLAQAAGNPKSLTTAAIGIVGLLVLFGIGYALSGDEVTAKYTQFGVDSGDSKFIGGVLTTMYFLFALALLSIVYSEVSKLLK